MRDGGKIGHKHRRDDGKRCRTKDGKEKRGIKSDERKTGGRRKNASTNSARRQATQEPTTYL